MSKFFPRKSYALKFSTHLTGIHEILLDERPLFAFLTLKIPIFHQKKTNEILSTIFDIVIRMAATKVVVNPSDFVVTFTTRSPGNSPSSDGSPNVGTDEMADGNLNIEIVCKVVVKSIVVANMNQCFHFAKLFYGESPEWIKPFFVFGSDYSSYAR